MAVFVMTSRSASLHSIMLFMSDSRVLKNFEGESGLSSWGSESLSTTISAMFLLAFVAVCAAIMLYINIGPSPYWSLRQGPATQSPRSGLCINIKSGSVKDTLGVAEHRAQIGPRSTGSASIVGENFLLDVQCSIEVNLWIESCGYCYTSGDKCRFSANVRLYRQFDWSSGLLVRRLERPAKREGNGAC